MNRTQQEQFYNEIVKLYDFAEKIIDAIEDERVKNPEEQVDLAEPVIRQIEESTVVMAENYLEFVKNGGKSTPEIKKQIESAIRRVYMAIGKFNDQLKKIKKG